MPLPLLLAHALLSAWTVSGVIHDYEHDCGWIDREKDRTLLDLDNIEVALLQQCIYFNRTMAYEYRHSKLHEDIPVEKVVDLNLRLSDIPPHGIIDVRVLHVLFFWIRMDERARMLNTAGSIRITWSDNRLAWDPKLFLERREIELDDQVDISSLWMPGVHAMGQPLDLLDPAAAVSHSMEPPIIDYQGNVTASFYFDLKQPAFLDYRNFPYDKQEICMEFDVRNKGHVSFPDSRFTLKLLQKFAAIWSNNPKWHAVDHDWEVRIEICRWRMITLSGRSDKQWKPLQLKSLPLSESESSAVGFEACAGLNRKSGTARIGIYMPLMMACVIAVCAPLFGAYHVQACMKVVALVLQFLCLNTFLAWLAELPVGDDVPFVLRYYEFVMVLTTISLVTVLAIWSISNMQFKARPHPRLVELSLALNRVFLCSRPPDPSSRYEPTPDANANQPTENLRDDWKIVALGLNNLFFVFYALIFVLGTLTLA